MRISKIPLSIAVGVLLVGCTPTAMPTPARSELPLTDIPTVPSPNDIALPIDAFLPTVDQTVAIMTAGVKLAESCYEHEGVSRQLTFSILETATQAEHPASQADLVKYVALQREESLTYSSMWGFFNPTTVSSDGYQRTTVDSINLSLSAPVTDPCFLRVDSVSPSAHAAFPFSVSDLPDGGSQWRFDDTRFIQAEAKWSDCMKNNGFSYATPREAISANINPSTGDEAVTAKAVAVADVQCKIDTNLVGIAVAVQSAYDQQYIDSHREALAAQQTQIADFIAGRVIVPDDVPSGAMPSSAAS